MVGLNTGPAPRFVKRYADIRSVIAQAAATYQAEVADGIRAPLRAMAERAWNGGSALTLAEFERVEAAIGLPIGVSSPR